MEALKVGIIAVECLAQQSFSALVTGIRMEMITLVGAIEDKTYPQPTSPVGFFSWS